MYRKVLFLIVIITSFTVKGQLAYPTIQKWNIGIYGLGAQLHYMKPFSALDFSYKGTTIRFAPTWTYLYGIYDEKTTNPSNKDFQIGIQQSLFKLSKVYYNLQFVTGIYWGKSNVNGEKPIPLGQDYLITQKEHYTFNIGVKDYFSNRWYSYLLAGATYSKLQTEGFPNESEIYPYVEFGLGFQIWKNYTNEESFK